MRRDRNHSHGQPVMTRRHEDVQCHTGAGLRAGSCNDALLFASGADPGGPVVGVRSAPVASASCGSCHTPALTVGTRSTRPIQKADPGDGR